MTDQDHSIGYAEAVAQLEAILTELEGDDVDVDVLSSRVKRAVELIHLCRQRITAAEMEVTRIVEGLDGDTSELA